MSDLLVLILSISLLRVPQALPCQRYNRQSPITAKECWAWIVDGESGGNWREASDLVAWTLRAWEIKLEMPAGEAGRMWGWNGWQKPSWEAYQAVDDVWGRPLIEAPYSFMQLGGYCKRLGSSEDVALWRSLGVAGDPYMTIAHPVYPNLTINCYLGTKRKN